MKDIILCSTIKSITPSFYVGSLSGVGTAAELNYASTMSLLLPDDVWSTSVFPYLDYQSMLRCSEVCQQFLHSVVPNVKELVIDDAHHMHPVPAHKFQGVERLDIRSYATFVQHKIRVCGETADRFVPFIAYFPKLKYVRLCGDDADKTFGRRQECQGLWLKNCWRNTEIVHTLIMTVCRAYYRGVISQNTTIFGMFDDVSLQDVQRYLHGHLLGDWDAAIGGYGPMSVAQYSPYEPGCRFCTSICSTIPVDQALLLCCPKNREDIFIDLSFCLLSPEKVSILISRPGGWEGYIKMFKGIYSKENINFDSISRGGEGRTFLGLKDEMNH